MEDKISVVINTYNCEKTFKECLESVKDFDEIVVCDMYSTDKTLELAKDYNCKIVMHEKIDFVEPARNFAISNASNEWVLVIDSDEMASKELKDYLYEFIKNPKNYTAIAMPRITYGWDEPLEVLYPDIITRFFKRDLVIYPPKIHAAPCLKEGEILKLLPKERKLAIIHMQNRTVSGWLKIIDTYTNYEIEKLKEKNKDINFAYHTWKSLWIIFEKFFFKGGYKNGIRGFIICVLMFGLYKFVVGCKWWEYKLKENK